jgi:RND family efflux transporter MFP subunit
MMEHAMIQHEDVPDKDDLAREIEPDVDRIPEHPSGKPPQPRLGVRARLLGLGAFLLLVGALAYGGWNYLTRYRAVMATAQQSQDFVPSVQVGEVRARDSKRSVTLPGTTAAFSAANIYARASGYIERRSVDIGDHVKTGQLLAQITAPELDHQISQAEATLGQAQATLLQTQANTELARVTNDRNIPLVKQGWVTTQQGDTTRLTLQAQEAAIGVAQANIAAWQSQLLVLRQQKAYQRVVAPFDGVITQRNIDVGDLLQADAASGTFMFSVMQSDVLRVFVYVPQDAAFGLAPGVDAVVRVPEIPGRTFPGKVTRIADALAPGTRTLLTEIDVPNPDGALSPGIYCTVELLIPQKIPTVLVSASAIIFNQDGLQVAVVKDGVARIQKISVSRDLGTAVEVRDGLNPGDQVILNPMVNLVDGSKVVPREPPVQVPPTVAPPG